MLYVIFLLYTEPKSFYWTKEKKVTINLVTELRLEVFILSFLISKDSKP